MGVAVGLQLWGTAIRGAGVWTDPGCVAGVVMGHNEWGAEYQPTSARHHASGHLQPNPL